MHAHADVTDGSHWAIRIHAFARHAEYAAAPREAMLPRVTRPGRARLGAWTRADLDADEVFCDAVCALVQAALEAIGNDPRARFRFFRELLAVARAARGADS